MQEAPGFRQIDELTPNELVAIIGRKESLLQSAYLRMQEMERILEAQRALLAQLQGTSDVAPETAPPDEEPAPEQTEAAPLLELPQPTPSEDLPAETGG